MKKRHVMLTALVTVALFSAACASASRKPAGQIADYGLKLAKAIEGAQESIGAVGKASTDQKIRTAAADALEKIDLANQKGLQLAPVLRALDGATSVNEAATNVTRAQAILNELVAAVGAVGGDLSKYPEFAASIKAAQAVISLVGTIQVEMGKTEVAK